MSFRINTNSNSAFSGFQIRKNQEELADSLKKLSTGKRINIAADDASGMVIADKLAAQADGMSQAVKNASDAVSIVQIADGALGQAIDIVQNIRVRAIQAAGAAHTPQSRAAIQTEIGQSMDVLKDIAQTTSFNGQKLLSGDFTDKNFQVGAASGETVTLSIGSIDPSQIPGGDTGALADIDVTTVDGAQAAIEAADAALEYLAAQRSVVGSTQNQLESTINDLQISQINTLAAQSEIRDLDYAEESINLNRLKMLAKVKTFAQAQANTTAGKIVDILG